jgi:hypothetical protein
MDKKNKQIQENLRKELNSNWDADDGMDDDSVRKSPLGIFAVELHKINPVVLERLTFFSALKALPCWELDCDSKNLKQVLKRIELSITDNMIEENLHEVSTPIQSPMKDCRYSNTQGAADAAGFCAKYILSKDPIDAVYSLSGAEVVYDHVYTNDNYREWLIDVALPIAFEKATISNAELNLKSENSKEYNL